MFAKRQDPSTGRLRWSLFLKELCYCQGVVALEQITTRTCSGQDDCAHADDLWFTDHPDPLTQRQNWSPPKLDQLLERSVLCCKSNCFFSVVDWGVQQNTNIIHFFTTD